MNKPPNEWRLWSELNAEGQQRKQNTIDFYDVWEKFIIRFTTITSPQSMKTDQVVLEIYPENLEKPCQKF